MHCFNLTCSNTCGLPKLRAISCANQGPCSTDSCNLCRVTGHVSRHADHPGGRQPGQTGKRQASVAHDARAVGLADCLVRRAAIGLWEGGAADGVPVALTDGALLLWRDLVERRDDGRRGSRRRKRKRGRASRVQCGRCASNQGERQDRENHQKSLNCASPACDNISKNPPSSTARTSPLSQARRFNPTDRPTLTYSRETAQSRARRRNRFRPTKRIVARRLVRMDTF
jgi:hypothetical protein